MINREKTCFSNTEPPQRRSAVQSMGCVQAWLFLPGKGGQAETVMENRGKTVEGVACSWCGVRGRWKADALRDQLSLPLLPAAGASGLLLAAAQWLLGPQHGQRGWTTGLWWPFPLWQATGHVPATSASASSCSEGSKGESRSGWRS